MKKMMRQVQNVWDGKYTIIGDTQEKSDRDTRTANGFRETDSRVVKKLLDIGLAIPQTRTDKPAKR